MHSDARGGHNKKSIDHNFFKTWSNNMAYILGFIYADGAVEDVRKSSRTCYIAIGITDLDLLVSIKQAMSSRHRIYIRKAHLHNFPNKKQYLARESYILRIGSKEMYSDLIKLGLEPRKSLFLRFPKIPRLYLSHFIRGYFDGDGCVNLHTKQNRITPQITTIFTCGSKIFLDELSKHLHKYAKTDIKDSYLQSNAFRLRYKKSDSLKLLSFIYKDSSESIFLKRKYDLYKKYLSL